MPYAADYAAIDYADVLRRLLRHYRFDNITPPLR